MIKVVALPPEPLGFVNATQDNPPHILLVVDQFPKMLGGGERIALKLAALLPRYGYRASILTFFVHSESAALKSPPCPIYLLPLRRTYGLQAIRAAFELRRFLKKQEIRIVHTFFESSDLWAGFVTKTVSKAKLVWSRRDMGILRNGKHRLAYRLMAGVPDAVFAVSEQVRRHSIEIDRIAPERVHTIYNGLDLDDCNGGPRPVRAPGNFQIATVGNIRKVKGHDVLIRAAATVIQKFPGAFFSVAGEILEPGYFAELKSLVMDLDLSNHFRFEGSITDVPQYLATADIFVLPSRSEGFSNAIIEAMAASLPVVATDVGGNAEAVKNGISGLIVPSDDPDALATAILRLLADPPSVRTMGAAGKDLATANFTTGAMMSRVAAAYRNLLLER
jgi:glycosyltransferase involved in cell wall biosynthesis